jgi:hypothetical protein
VHAFEKRAVFWTRRCFVVGSGEGSLDDDRTLLALRDLAEADARTGGVSAGIYSTVAGAQSRSGGREEGEAAPSSALDPNRKTKSVTHLPVRAI